MVDEVEKVVVSPPVKSEHGAQVVLTGEARAAARGGAAGDMAGNMLVKASHEADGTAADGSTADGTTRTGVPQPDDIRSDTPDAPGGKLPPSRVVVAEADGSDKRTVKEAAEEISDPTQAEQQGEAKADRGDNRARQQAKTVTTTTRGR